ncbi:hypothetical protein [Snuella sedimenti]|uniref:Uncharacterized protein n=1 Tax=Snuella sedimenti TaxID=2798802 RepID=A0A8J7LM46_9FLAO|nr:hypothetical protein [Snuella sedimenti]MBJ6367074.1 hypothetical protein [Snuella sedimenti]
MKTNFLLPYKYKKYGGILFILGIIFGIILQITDSDQEIFDFDFITDFGYNFLDEVISILIILGGLILGFSKEKIEDEFIYKLRKDSLVWAIIFNYTILLFAIVFFYDGNFFSVMIYNMFTPLIFFIIRFNFLKLKLRSHEE